MSISPWLFPSVGSSSKIRFPPRPGFGIPGFGGADLTPEVSQVLFRLSRWENLEYVKKILTRMTWTVWSVLWKTASWRKHLSMHPACQAVASKLDLTSFCWTPDIQPSRVGKKGNLPPCPGTKNSSHATVWPSTRTTRTSR